MGRPTEQELEKLVADDDYVYNRRFGCSLAKLLERYPDGAPNSVIAASLLMLEEEIEPFYEQIVAKLRRTMKVE